MKRLWLVPLLALASLAVSPSNASAHFFYRWCAPYGGWSGGYSWSVPCPTPYFVPQYYLVPAPLYYSVPLAPPQLVPGTPIIPQAKPTSSPRSDAPLRPSPRVTVTPEAVPPIAVVPEADPQVKPATGNAAIPAPAPSPPSPLTIPDPMVPKSPLTIPDPVVPKAPPKMVPEANPMVIPEVKPAPGSGDEEKLPLIPLPAPRKTPTTDKNGKDELPPLVLPPEGTGTSSGVIPPVVVKSSPLKAAVTFKVYATAGTAAGNLRKIGFFNHTDRDLDLVIEGQSVRLPKKSYLHAQLPARFTWNAAGNAANATTVPADAAGVDVLFRE